MSWHEADPGGEIPGMPKLLGISDSGDECGGTERANAGDADEALTEFTATGDQLDLVGQLADGVIQFSPPAHKDVQQAKHDARKAGVSVVHEFRQAVLKLRSALGDSDAVFQEKCPDLVDLSGPFPDQAIAGAVQRLEVEFLDRFHAGDSHVAAHGGFGDGLRIVEVVLVDLRKGAANWAGTSLTS